MDTSGVNRGYLNFVDNSLRRDQSQQQIDLNAMALQDAQRKRQAEALAGPALMELLAGGGAPEGGSGMLPDAPAEAQAPLPGTQSMPAGGAPEGTGTVLAPQGGQQPGPYLAYDDAIAKAQQPPALPAAPAAAPAPAAATRSLSLQGIVQTLKKQGVPDNMVMSVLQSLTPVMSAENKAELMALNSQVKIMAAQQKIATDGMRNDLAEQRLNWYKEREAMRMESKDKDRAGALQRTQERIAAQARGQDIQVQNMQRLAKNDADRVAFKNVQARNLQMKAIGAEFSSLSNVLVNGNAEQRAQAQERLAVLQTQYDQLYEQYADETQKFLDHVDDQAAAATAVKPAEAKPAAASAAPAGNARPPKPTEPGFDYRYDEARGVWQRKPKAQ